MKSEREPADTGELITVAIFLSIVLGFFLVEVIRNYEPLKLSVLLLIGFWAILLVGHEAGHALVSLWLGWRVEKVVLGIGREMGRFYVCGIEVEVRMFPVEGFVLTRPTNLVRPQTKSSLIYFAGPAVDLLVALIVLLVVGSDRLFTRSEDLTILVWQTLALAGASQGLLNLIPHSIQTPQGSVANDGMGIIQSFRRPIAHYAAMIEPEDSQRW